MMWAELRGEQISPRGKQVGWVVIGVALAFIVGYLVKYGGPSYARGTAGYPPAGTGTSSTKSSAPPAAVIPPTPSAGLPAANSCPAIDAPPPPAPKPKATAPSAALPPTKPGAPVPAVKFAVTEFDFGTVYQEQKVRHEYAFVNAGKLPLRITNVVSTCGCAVGQLPEKEFAPGEHGVIPVTFDAGRLRNRVIKHIYVNTNDPANPRVVLTLKAVVKMEAEVQPSGVYFARLVQGRTAEFPVDIHPVGVSELRLRAFESSDPHIATTQPVEEIRPTEDGNYHVVLRIGPYPEPKLVDAKVKITTDLKHQPVLTIPVYGWVVSEEQQNVPADASKLAP